ncbi:MAG: DUF1778 domain-containing protein [Pseudoclavibacter sp.]
MSSPAPKTERIQLRTSPAAKSQIAEAAALTQQDVSSFILDTATSRARQVILEHQLIRLSPADIAKIENAFAHADEVPPALQALLERVARNPRIS